MSAPRLKAPEFTMEPPVSGKKIKYRPFLVAEEKAMLMAKQSGNDDQMVQAMRGIVEECTFKKIDPAKDSMVDVVYAFLMIRARSAGETSTIGIPCSDESCEGVAEVTVDLTQMKVEIPEIDNVVEVGVDAEGKKVLMELKPMTFDDFGRIETDRSVTGIETDITTIKSCTVDVSNEDGESYHSADWTDEEWEEFYSGFTSLAYKSIAEFFGNAPRISLEVKGKCGVCKKPVDREVSELANFT